MGTRAFAVHVPTEDDAGRAAGTVALVDGLACSVETGHWASRREIGYWAHPAARGRGLMRDLACYDLLASEYTLD